MSSFRSPGPSSSKRSRRIRNLGPVPDDDAESVSDNNDSDHDSDPRFLQILSDSEPPTFAIEQPSYMNDESSFGDIDFATLVKDEKYYVDKTDLIPRILNLSEWAIAIFRHRNAMKTTHLKSLECYCDWKPIEGLDFEKLNVKTNDHFRKYCVLFIPFDRIILTEAKDANDVVVALKMVILDSVLHYLRKHHLDEPEIDLIMEKLSGSNNAGLLSDICFRFHHKFSKKVIILFDNVDVPFLNYDVKYTELAYKILFNGFMSDHTPFCFKLIMMGNIAPHCFFKMSSFRSKLLVDCGYRVNVIGLEYFMFNEKDVEKLCIKYDHPVPQTVIELKSRYGGYKVEDNYLFNSFSIVEFFNSNSSILDSTRTSILWRDFHSEDVLHASSNIKISKAERFIWTRLLESDGNISVNIHVILNYDDFIHDLYIGFKFLLYGAYLTIVEEKYPNTTLKIPNKEVREIFRDVETNSCRVKEAHRIMKNQTGFSMLVVTKTFVLI